jgi:hypothetical protein
MGWVALIVVGALAVVATGYVIGLAVSSPGEIRSPAGGDPNTCADFCLAWERARAALCGARSNLAAARAFADQCWNAWLMALATAAALTAASVAAAFIPFFGGAIAATLSAAALTAMGTAVTLYAVWLGAALAVVTKQNELGNRENEVQAARLKVLENCPADEAARCLAAPAPC